MSGGHFSYDQYHLVEIADEIGVLIQDNDKIDEYGSARGYSQATLAKFEEAERTLRLAARMMQRVDYLVSGDDGEESFHSRWGEDTE